MMTTRQFWMTQASRLGCAFIVAMVSACTVDVVDNPGPTADEESAVDWGTWHVKDEYMDKSVQPGDDFFMYCNGGYWKSTEVNEEKMFQSLLLGQVLDATKQKVEALTLPSKTKVMADMQKTDAATMAAQRLSLQQAAKRVDALTTKQEAWQLMADLSAEGYNCPLGLMTFAKNGKVGFIFMTSHDPEYLSMHEWSSKRLAWQLANNPELLAMVQPVAGGSRRSFDPGQWPMLVTMCNTLGIPLEDAYTVDADPFYNEVNMVDYHVSYMSKIQNRSVDEWKQVLKSAIMEDAVYFDNDSAAARFVTCQDAVSAFLDLTINYEASHAFAKAYVTDGQKQQVRELTELLRQTFRQRIEQSTWLSAASKQKAIEKLEAMVFNIGAPDEWFEEGLPNLSSEQTLVDDIRALRRSKLALKRKICGMSIQRGSFHQQLIDVPLATVNAFYVQSGNYMNIMPPFMSSPLFDSQQNDAHNFACMTIWGHEITHGFDTNGAKYNKVGDLGTLWASEADNQEFQRRTGQLVSLYGSYDIMPFDTGLKPDGEYTLAENVADLGGFMIAHDAYVKHLDSHGFKGAERRLQLQRFYQAFAYISCSKWTSAYAKMRTMGQETGGGLVNTYEKDEHSLYRERVNGVVVNSDDWYDLFDVKPGNKLYLAPENRVRIW